MVGRRKGSTAATMRFAHDGEKLGRVVVDAEGADQDDTDATVEQFVVLLRHGIAEERTEEKPDSERSLTREGIQKMKKISRGLAEIFPDAEMILSSPLVRCVQTALWVSKSYEKKIPVKTADELKPDATADAFLRLLTRTKERRLILIGHEPALTNAMLTLTRGGAEARFELKKGGAYGIRQSANAGSVEWMLSPRILRRLR